LPEWLHPGLIERLALRAGRRETSAEASKGGHPRSWLFDSLNNPFWAHLFEGYDPGTTHQPVEVRYPYYDLRVIGYMLAIPPVPWCLQKRLSRDAMRGILPEAVRRRPKALMAADPVRKRLEESGLKRSTFPPHSPFLRSYVRPDWSILPETNTAWGDTYWVNLRPLALNLWLHSEVSTDITGQRLGEKAHEESSGKPVGTQDLPST
jgi:asparagine synthase (glutamine-hydrolysing)